MFDNQPTTPQIVAQILSLSEGWKQLLGPEVEAEKHPPKRKTSKRKTKA
jgi:hypothetical protein